MARDEHDLRVDLPLAKTRERGETVNPRQPHIEDDQVHRAAHEAIEAGFAARHRFDRVTFVVQHAGERGADARFVVDDQNRGSQQGNSIVKRVPRGALSPTSMLPPCSAMIRRTIASPRPLPRRLVE